MATSMFLIAQQKTRAEANFARAERKRERADVTWQRGQARDTAACDLGSVEVPLQ